MSLYTSLLESLINLKEYTYSNFMAKGRSASNLWPKFPSRVDKIRSLGGPKLIHQFPEVWEFSVPSSKEGSYTVYLRFKNIPAMITKYASDRRLWNKEETGVDYNLLGPEIMNHIDMESDCACKADCLVADTKIPLLNGQTLTIKELLKQYNKDKDFWVYSVDTKGNFIPGKAKHLGVIGKVNKLIKITLDNDKYFECTPDHRIMLRNGNYKKAQDLIIGESLMPLYFKLSEKTLKNKYSYLEIKLNSLEKGKSSWRKVHGIINNFIYKEKKEVKTEERIITKLDSYLITHHKDLNPLNNDPNNLEWMGNREHNDLHRNKITEAAKKWFEIPGNLAFSETEKGREFLKNMKTKYWVSLSEKEKEETINNMIKGKTLGGRKKCSESITKSWGEGKLKFPSHKPWLNLVGKKYSEESKVLQKVGKIMQVCFEILENNLEISEANYSKFRKINSPLYYQFYFGSLETLIYFINKAKENSFDNKYRGLKKEDIKELISIVKEIQAKPKICPHCSQEFTDGKKLHIHINNLRMKEYRQNYFKINKEKQLEYYKNYYQNNKEKINQQSMSRYYNHKIKNIEIIDLEIPVEVYDIAVEDSHNFLLECGNIVHNSFWGMEYIKTQKGAQFGDQENRPPKVKNPRQLGIICKHAQTLFTKLPSYNFTFNGFLKFFWHREIEEIFNKAKTELEQYELAKSGLKKKEEEKPVAFGRGGKPVELPEEIPTPEEEEEIEKEG